jgi:hypothetical protein
VSTTTPSAALSISARPGSTTGGDATILKAEAVRRPAMWYLKRATLGLFLMVVTVAAGAWLFHSTIEAEAGDGSRFGTYSD